MVVHQPVRLKLTREFGQGSGGFAIKVAPGFLFGVGTGSELKKPFRPQRDHKCGLALGLWAAVNRTLASRKMRLSTPAAVAKSAGALLPIGHRPDPSRRSARNCRGPLPIQLRLHAEFTAKVLNSHGPARLDPQMLANLRRQGGLAPARHREHLTMGGPLQELHGFGNTEFQPSGTDGSRLPTPAPPHTPGPSPPR